MFIFLSNDDIPKKIALIISCKPVQLIKFIFVAMVLDKHPVVA